MIVIRSAYRLSKSKAQADPFSVDLCQHCQCRLWPCGAARLMLRSTRWISAAPPDITLQKQFQPSGTM